MMHIKKITPETGLDLLAVEDNITTKTKLMSFIPFKFIVYLRVLKNRKKLKEGFHYDAKLQEAYSSAIVTGDTQEKLNALITLAYHNIEKGLSLRSPRPLFGRAAIRRLNVRLQRYVTEFGWTKSASVALNVLNEYRHFNLTKGKEDPELEKIITSLLNIKVAPNAGEKKGGTKILNKEEIHAACKVDLSSFFAMRSSVRNYSQENVAEIDIVAAVKMAQKTPSVCNRQSGRVTAVNNKELINNLLNLQGGARGFDDQVPCLLIITSDLSSFQAPAERYQCWIDGGLFAMSLIYALHSLGLGTCCLNWSKMPHQDEALYSMLPHCQGERVIMMLAVGHYPDSLTVPQSASPAMDDVLRWQR